MTTRPLSHRRKDDREHTGSCPIREHTGDGAYVGRCEHSTYDRVCPRHGLLEDYPNNSDYDVFNAQDRRFVRALYRKQP